MHSEGQGSCGRKEQMRVHQEREEREAESESEIHADEERSRHPGKSRAVTHNLTGSDSKSEPLVAVTP